MIEKHYGDARVDTAHLDANPLPSKAKEPFVFYGVPSRAGDRGRTADVQLGNEVEEGPEDYDPWA
jgi:hypothetical protein